jgi:glycerophosphoryl diester phosphodiesterase
VNKQPLIISHRGDRNNSVENTIEACELAIGNGAAALEIDIRQTGSGEIVVFHDFSLRRMFDISGYIGRTPLRELKNIPYKKISGGQSQLYIETLNHFLEHFKNRVRINLDAKTIHFFDFSFADKIISILKNHNLFDSVWISCFNPFLLQILKLKERKIRTGYLFQRVPWLHTSYDLITWTDAWHPHFRIVDQRLVRKAQKSGKEIYVWTVNEREVLDRLLAFPITGIICDEVKKIRRYLDQP